MRVAFYSVALTSLVLFSGCKTPTEVEQSVSRFTCSRDSMIELRQTLERLSEKPNGISFKVHASNYYNRPPSGYSLVLDMNRQLANRCPKAVLESCVSDARADQEFQLEGIGGFDKKMKGPLTSFGITANYSYTDLERKGLHEFTASLEDSEKFEKTFDCFLRKLK